MAWHIRPARLKARENDRLKPPPSNAGTAKIVKLTSCKDSVPLNRKHFPTSLLPYQGGTYLHFLATWLEGYRDAHPMLLELTLPGKTSAFEA